MKQIKNTHYEGERPLFASHFLSKYTHRSDK